MRVSPSSGPGMGSKSMGEYLHEIYADDYIVIVSSLDSYVDRNNQEQTTFEGAPVVPTRICERCIEREIVQIPNLPEMFFVDFKNTSGLVKEYFSKPREMRFQTGFQPYVLDSAFDALFWKRTATPAISYRSEPP